jgi:hypothetical protein
MLWLALLRPDEPDPLLRVISGSGLHFGQRNGLGKKHRAGRFISCRLPLPAETNGG